MKRNQWRKASNKVFKFDQDLDKAYRQLFGPFSPAGCSICGEESIESLDIHTVDDRPGLHVLCDKCYDAMRQSFDDKLQKQIEGNHA